jgi:hypothetical protein
MRYKKQLLQLLEQEDAPMNDQQDHVSFDIPLLIRLFELVREDVKSDVTLHKIVEKILSMKDEGVLTMEHYDAIASANEQDDQEQLAPADSGEAPELESLKKLAGI